VTVHSFPAKEQCTVTDVRCSVTAYLPPLIPTRSLTYPRQVPPMTVHCSRSHSLACLATVLLGLLHAPGMRAQAGPMPGAQAAGPVIQSAGPSFAVDSPSFVIPARHDYKAVYVISAGGGDTAKVNEQLVTLARFYNATVRNGHDESRVHAAAVFHSNGWQAVLNDSAFAARFGKPNPSRRLVEELLLHGATLVLCGQTAGRAGVRVDEMLPGVKLGVSAITALEYLQSQGYRYIPW
jgi:intracellular sulfur oxidation DsrE/DsrF family protein